MRRDLAALGFLHRVKLGKVSEQIMDLFQPVGARPLLGSSIGSRVRGATAFHSKQLLDRVSASSSDQFKRSLFGMVQCYNALPQWVVEKTSVSAFQRALQKFVIHRVQEGAAKWNLIFSFG